MALQRMLLTIAAGLVLAGIIYFWHPGWFSNRSSFQLPVLPPTPTAGPTAIPAVKRPTPTPITPRVGMAQHIDDVWIAPIHVQHTQGAGGIVPNVGDEFLVVYLRIANRSQQDYSVRVGDFQILDGNGELDPPLLQDFTRQRLREVRLIPQGHTSGTLIFEVPRTERVATLIYEPDTLDPSKRKEWLIL